MKPGVYCWGGSSGWRSSQLIPYAAIDVWERDNGWADQHHLQEIDLSSYYSVDSRGTFRPEGLELQIALAKRIIDGGGEVQMMVWATPAHLATRPLTGPDSMDDNRRASWMKYKPRSFDGWATIFAEVAKRIAAKVDPNKLWFGIGMESHRFKFRNTVADFLNLVDATQTKLKPLGLPHVGMTQVPDLIDGQLGRMPQFIPTFDFIDRYLKMGKQKGWRVDFLPLFEYSGDAIRMRQYVQMARGLLNTYGYDDCEIIWNGLSPLAEMDNEKSVEMTIAVGKMLLAEGVTRACLDFLEDSEPATRQMYQPNGLLTYQTLAPRPRYELAKRVCQMGGF